MCPDDTRFQWPPEWRGEACLTDTNDRQDAYVYLFCCKRCIFGTRRTFGPLDKRHRTEPTELLKSKQTSNIRAISFASRRARGTSTHFGFLKCIPALHLVGREDRALYSCTARDTRHATRCSEQSWNKIHLSGHLNIAPMRAEQIYPAKQGA